MASPSQIAAGRRVSEEPRQDTYGQADAQDGSKSARRPCDACGGTGRCYPLPSSNVCVCGHSLGHHRNTGTPGWDSCTWGCGCLDYDAQTAHVKDLCPACSGRGWQSDAMPVSDALADAETLRLYTDKRPRLRGDVSQLLCDAEFYGKRSVLPQAILAEFDAKSAARRAFRAVPGLRG